MGVATQMLRIGPFLIRRAKLAFAVTSDEIDEANEVGDFEYWSAYSNQLLALVITMFFAITMPATPPFGLLYFITHTIADRYQLGYVFPPAKIASDGM